MKRSIAVAALSLFLIAPRVGEAAPAGQARMIDLVADEFASCLRERYGSAATITPNDDPSYRIEIWDAWQGNGPDPSLTVPLTEQITIGELLLQPNDQSAWSPDRRPLHAFGEGADAVLQFDRVRSQIALQASRECLAITAGG